MQVGGLNSSLIRFNSPYEQNQTTAVNSTSQEENTNKKTNSEEKLTSAEQAQVSKLEARDSAVRQHEAAHIAAGGSVIKSGASFTYQKGPDNKLYAIGGEVAIDTGKEATPEETIAKMQTVRAAALAPSDPSSTDYQVASSATMMEMRARMELTKELSEQTSEGEFSSYEKSDSPSKSEEFSLYA